MSDEEIAAGSNGVEDPTPRPPKVEQGDNNKDANNDPEGLLASINSFTGMTEKPRQWLMDRSNGCSHVDEETLGRPFCPMCWPPPCVKFAPGCMEQNRFCEWFGNIGAFPENHATSRIWLMRKSLLLHFGGFVMSALACAALTTNPDLLQRFSFSSGTVTGTVGQTDIRAVTFEVGLRSIYTYDNYFGGRVYELNDVCTGTTLGIPLTPIEECQSCYEASSGLVFTVIMGVVTYLPTIASNVNRAYYNYDVNCQKVFGTIVAIISMIMSLYTWHGYARQCFGTFFDGDITVPVLIPKGVANGTVPRGAGTNLYMAEYFDPSALRNRTAEDIQENGLTIEELFPNVNATILAQTEIQIARVNFDWKPGVGLILVVMATFLKLFDIINHFLIKTPSITRNLQEQMEYEKKYGKNATKEEEAEEVGGGGGGSSQENESALPSKVGEN